jgi:hypothetical protein
MPVILLVARVAMDPCVALAVLIVQYNVSYSSSSCYQRQGVPVRQYAQYVLTVRST